MAGNGYFDSTSGVYRAKSVETWDDFQGSSAGDDWDSITTWHGTPVLPLEFEGDVIDYGKSTVLNYLVDVVANAPANVEVRYGDTLQSAGGIDNYQTISTTPNQSNILAKKGRYWQFVISIPQTDSAGSEPDEYGLTSFSGELRGEVNIQSNTDLDTSTLSGTVGQRQLELGTEFGTVSSIVATAHSEVASPYVVSGYVADGYFAEAVDKVPVITVDKSSTPIVLNIYDTNASGAKVDCVLDAVITGLRAMQTNSTGSIVEAD